MRLERRIENKNRAVGGLLSGEIARRHGEDGLPEGSIEVHLEGSAGQSFGAWLAAGVTLELEGDANDYTGKGLSGGTLVVRPSSAATFRAEDNAIVGNTVLYGATSGKAFFRGLAGERFAVRNSGAVTVVEGVGDHGCEYMTGGRVVVLGPTGLNFAAGMSGGVAYVLDVDGGFRSRCNTELVGFDEITPDEALELRGFDRGAPRAHRLAGGGARARVLGRRAGPLREGDAARLQAGAAGADAGRSRGLMGDPRGFLRLERVGFQKRDPRERVRDYRQYFSLPDDGTLREQGGRCMDCGVPFCQEGCPLGNKIPDWNDLVYSDRWREALTHLHATNNFPEFTGLICPAPCESACVLDINDDAVTIEQIELAIVTRGYDEGWIVPTRRRRAAATRSGWSDRARPAWPSPPS